MSNPFGNIAFESPPPESTPAPFGGAEAAPPPVVANEAAPSPFESPPPSPFGETPTVPSFGFGNLPPAATSSQTMKYNIIDMYWFLNLRLFTPNTAPLEGECNLLTVGYNADFGNMRLTFYNINQDGIICIPGTKMATSILISRDSRVSSVNLYPEACSQILAGKNKNQPIKCLERIFKADTSWSPSATEITWYANPNCILVNIVGTNKSKHCFTISGWQIEAFENALSFMTNGMGWFSNLLGVINK